MLPEEEELARLDAQQKELEEQLVSAELSLETTATETERFKQRYFHTVGRLYAELDELEVKISNERLKQAPDDPDVRAYAKASEERAKLTAEEAGLIEPQPNSKPEITPILKQAYRRAVKQMHPDLALTEKERLRRTSLMAQINLAYHRGDLASIERLIKEYGADPEAIVGEDVASRIVKTIRRNSQLRRRADEIKQEVEALLKTDIYRLKKTIEEQEANGLDPLGKLADELKKQIVEKKLKSCA
ncbi:MAG: molecular chaperone DnaJ [Alphaproteobacteria bacterium]